MLMIGIMVFTWGRRQCGRDGKRSSAQAEMLEPTSASNSIITRMIVVMFQPLDTMSPSLLPESVEEVVDMLYRDLSVRDRMVMAGLSEAELDSAVYLAMAKIIRKEFGLYERNQALINSCRDYLGSRYDPYEDPAMVIIKELWRKLKKSCHLRLVKG
jgi:hypothetical protein